MVQVYDGDGVEPQVVGIWRFSWDAPHMKDNIVEARYLNVDCGDIQVCAIDFETDTIVKAIAANSVPALLDKMEDEVANLIVTKGQHRLLEQWPDFGLRLRMFLKVSMRRFIPGFG